MSRFDPKPPFFARLAQMEHDATVARIVGEPMRHVCSPPASRPQGAEPPDPPGCVWRGTGEWDGAMVRMGEDGPETWYRTEDGAWRHDPRGADIFAAAFLSERARFAAMTQERDDERIISAGHEERADRSEAALADVSDRIAALQVALAGGRVP